MDLARRSAPILLLALVAGCGGPAPVGRIAVGTPATARGEGDEPVPVFFAGRSELLATGTRVQVLSDGEGDPSQPRRRVVVAIQDGPSRGLAALMYRSDLRPGD